MLLCSVRNDTDCAMNFNMLEREKLQDWMRLVLEETGWSKNHWADLAKTSPTNITRFLKDPDASMPTIPTLNKLRDPLEARPQYGHLSDMLVDDTRKEAARGSNERADMIVDILGVSMDVPMTEMYAAIFDKFGQYANKASDLLFQWPVDRARDGIRNLLAEIERGPEEIRIPALSTMPRDLPVRGIAVGGDDEFFEFNGQIVDYVRRPPGLATATHAFAIYVAGDSMSPRFNPGELVFIHPGRPAQPGSDVLIELLGSDGEPGHCFIKKLVRRTAKKIILAQYNPRRDDINIPTKKVRTIYRILAAAELLGV